MASGCAELVLPLAGCSSGELAPLLNSSNTREQQALSLTQAAQWNWLLWWLWRWGVCVCVYWP